MFVESTVSHCFLPIPCRFKNSKACITEIFTWNYWSFLVPTLKNQENAAKHQVMAAYYPLQIAIQLIFKAVSMTGTLAWHLEIVLQLKIHPLGFSALWSVCVLRSPFRSGLSLQGYSGEKIHSVFSRSLNLSELLWLYSLLTVLDDGAFILAVCSLPSRRCCGGGASTNQNCRAALCRNQRFLWGTEAWNGGEVTSDETSSTPDHLDSLRAMKLQPGRDSLKEKGLNFKDNTDKVHENQRRCCFRNKAACGEVAQLCCWIFSH